MRNNLRKALAGLSLAALLLYNGGMARADESSARAAYAMDRATGRALFAANETAQLPMASTTKIMTALLALENAGLDEMVETGERAFGVPGTSIYLQLGEALSVEQMLYGLLLASGNDAAVALAEHVGGSVEGFCAMMTSRAAELGAQSTRFVNPHGLPADGHLTTARDLTLIASEALENPVFREIVGTTRASIPWAGHEYDRVLRNKNALLRNYPGAIGVKTGFTRAAGRCLVFAAERDGFEVVGTVLNCPDWFGEAARILDAVYARYAWTKLLEEGDAVCNLPVRGGVTDSVEIVAQADLAAPLLSGETATLSLSLPDALLAPLPEGAQAGWAYLMLDGGEILARVPLVTSKSVEKPPSALSRIIENWLTY